MADSASRRSQRRQRFLVFLGTVVASAAVALAVPIAGLPQAAAQGDRVDDMPASIVDPPSPMARIEDSPLPRALVAFTEAPSRDITLVGPRDQYRVYQGGEGRPVLSPDGRHLLTGRGLLDVATGVTRSLGNDAPLAFSPDGRSAVTARYDSDIEVRGEIRVSDVSTGELLWSMNLEPGPLPADVHVALSPDGSMIAIQRHAELSVYREGILAWRTGNGVLAGQKAFVPERRAVVVASPAGICLLDAQAGQGGLCHSLSGLRRLTAGPMEVVGWSGGFPIINTSMDVVSLQGVPEVLLEGPGRVLQFLGVATEGVRWSKRQPGPPDAGPFIDRYRPMLNIAGGAAFVIVVIVMAIRRWGRPRRTASKR